MLDFVLVLADLRAAVNVSASAVVSCRAAPRAPHTKCQHSFTTSIPSKSGLGSPSLCDVDLMREDPRHSQVVSNDP